MKRQIRDRTRTQQDGEAKQLASRLVPVLIVGLLGSPPAWADEPLIDPPPNRVQPLYAKDNNGPTFGHGQANSFESFSPLARLIAEASSLIRYRQFRQAYRMLSPATDLYAGDVEFDYMLGIAALESGRPGESVLALERVLINEPNRPRTRADLQRAHTALEELESARREFAAAAARQIPPGARQTSGRFIDSVSRVKNQPDPVFEMDAVVGIGHDNNVIVGNLLENWVRADGLELAPESSVPARESLYISTGAGLKSTLPVNGRIQWVAGLSAIARNAASAHQLDQAQVDFSTGMVYRNSCHQLKALGQAQHLSVDSSGFRNAIGVIGQWQCDLNAERQLGVYVQHTEFRFPDQRGLNAARQSLGFSAVEMFPAVRNSMLLGTVHTGNENSRAGSTDLDYTFAGVRVMVVTPIVSGLRSSIGFGYEHRRFNGADMHFGASRDDEQAQVSLGLQGDINARWTLEPQVLLTRNRSNIEPRDFQRTRVQLVARYAFR